ncbi:MAG: NACHT domain-containing protein, partial [Ardenticatenaceae bacterium]
MNNKLVYRKNTNFEKDDLSLWEKFKSIFLRWFYNPSPPSSPLAVDYQKPYVEHLLNCHRDVKGFFVAGAVAPLLGDVFVEPQLLPLAAISVESPSWADYSSQNRPSDTSPTSLWEWVEQSRALWIIGLPGSGKTSLLSQMALTLGKRLAEEEESSHQLPIMLFLRDHSPEIHKNPTYTLAEAAQDASSINMPDPPPSNWFSEQLKKGQCVLMMDGLDEVPHLQRRGVATWIEQQIKAYGNNRFVIASRPLDRQLLRGVTVLEVQPFTKQQVQRFVERWYLAHQDEHVASIKAQENAEALINLIGISQPPQKEMAFNPLLLTMIATCQGHLRSLDAQGSDHISAPQISSRADLYAKVCDLLLDRQVPEFDLTAAQKRRVLQPLAIEMMKHKRGFVSLDEARQVLYVPLDMISRNPNVSEFLQMVENQGLLCQEDGEYRFAQRTFQEYLAGCHLQEQRLERELVKGSCIQDSWWHETIRFYCTRADATPIIAACLRHQNDSFSILRLAIDCATGEVEPEMQHRLEKRLKEEIDAWRPGSMQHRVVSQGLLSLRLKSLIAVDETLYVSDSLITNAEYQLFLNETGAEQEAIPAHWSQAVYAPLDAVAGIRPSDALAFCEWLTERDPEGRSYRLPTIGEFKPLLSETAYWAREGRGQTIKLQNDATTQISLSALESRLCSALTRDLVENGESARERALAFAQELEQVRNPADALAKACEFTYDGAHYGTMNPSKANASHSDSQKQATHYQRFEQTRIAKFVTERLLRVLREDGTAPAPSPNTAPT